MKKEFLLAPMPRSILFVSIVCIGTVFGVMGYVMTKKQVEIEMPGVKTSDEIIEDKIADWKTYRNEEYGFEFDYPADLNIKEKVEPVDWKSFSVFLESESFSGYFLFNSPGVGTGFSINVVKEDITIGDINTNLEVLDSSVDNQRATILKFNKGDNEYFWLFRFDKKDSDKIDLSKKIFSTFKFIGK